MQINNWNEFGAKIHGQSMNCDYKCEYLVCGYEFVNIVWNNQSCIVYLFF